MQRPFGSRPDPGARGPSAGPAPQRPAAPDAPGGSYRLLVVDDNPTIHDDFQRIFGSVREPTPLDDLAAAVFDLPRPPPGTTYTLDHASQGQQALERVIAAREGERPYALLFMDVRMPPGWDGVQTCARVLEADPDVHVVLCTGYLERGWKQRVEALPGRDRVLVLKKPFDVLEVQQLASALCERWTYTRRDRARMRELERSVTEQRGRLAAAATRLRDEIASRTLVERRLDKARRLEGLGRMAAGMCHEINNPLSFIVTSTELIEQQLDALGGHIPSVDHEELTELVQELSAGAERITRIVRNIKMFARNAELPTERVDLAETIASAVRMLQLHLVPRVELRVEASGAEPVQGRRLELEQVLINLVENSLHALAAQREPPPRIGIMVGREGEAVRIDVSDNGPGIDAAIIEKIFDPFFTTKAVGKGTGLGLAICHNLVRGMAGTIDVVNNAERGVTFTLTLPRATGPEPAPQARPGWARTPTSRPAPTEAVARVLVIDDEPLGLRMLERALRPHAVTTTSSVTEALALCDERRFDLIVCDVVMPGLDGRDFHRMLGERQPDEQSRVVFVTGGGLHEDVRAFFDQIPNHTLEKPFDVGELRALITERLERLERLEHRGAD
ncbi:MAG: response regulator [Myxococcales bacterium]|nr:response regulator [Myxococcales bacterium]